MGDSDTHAYLLISGTISIIKPDALNIVIRAGSIVGDLAALEDTRRNSTCRTLSPCRMLVIPSVVLKYFMKRNNLTEEFIRKNKESLFFVQKTNILDNNLSILDQCHIATTLKFEEYHKKEYITVQNIDNKGLIIIKKGIVNMYKDNTFIDTLSPYSIVCESSFLNNTRSEVTLIANSDVEIGRTEDRKLLEMPIIRFRLKEIEAKRKAKFSFK